jgi:hypothetical protein
LHRRGWNCERRHGRGPRRRTARAVSYRPGPSCRDAPRTASGGKGGRECPVGRLGARLSSAGQGQMRTTQSGPER